MSDSAEQTTTRRGFFVGLLRYAALGALLGAATLLFAKRSTTGPAQSGCARDGDCGRCPLAGRCRPGEPNAACAEEPQDDE